MTNEEIEREAKWCLELRATSESNVTVAVPPDLEDRIRRAMRDLVSRAYEEAAQVADQCEKEADESAEREGLPIEYGGDPEIAERIRALKNSLTTA